MTTHRIAVSNIAWDPDRDAEVARLLVGAGVQGIEIAPTMIWDDPTGVSPSEARRVAGEWAARGLPVVAFQALLYGRPELGLFRSGAVRGAMRDHLVRIIDLAEAVGAGRLVFGSPGNRRRDGIPEADALGIATDFFRDLGEQASGRGAVLCLEPNPVDYGCDFVTTAAEGRALVRAVDHPGFRLHLDTGGMTLAGDDAEEDVRASAPWLGHFHVSEPRLAPIEEGPVQHAAFAAALEASGYGGWRSVEMRNPGDLDRLRASVELAVRRYGG